MGQTFSRFPGKRKARENFIFYNYLTFFLLFPISAILIFICYFSSLLMFYRNGFLDSVIDLFLTEHPEAELLNQQPVGHAYQGQAWADGADFKITINLRRVRSINS